MLIFRRCPVQLCKNRINQRFICCRDCWMALPAWARKGIQEERDACTLAGIPHSQKLHRLRDQAIAMLSARKRDRFAKPTGDQLALIP